MWSLLLLAATVWSLAYLVFGLSDRNKMVLWTGCGGRARCNFHRKELRSVWFVVKRRGCCFKLSVGVALNMLFTTNGMCTSNNIHIYVARTTNNRVIVVCDLCCCLLLQCEALGICHSGFPIATGTCSFGVGTFHRLDSSLLSMVDSRPPVMCVLFFTSCEAMEFAETAHTREERPDLPDSL